MSLDTQKHPATTAGTVKYCYLGVQKTPATGVEYVPRYYFEAKIDFADVRSGVRETCSLSNAVDIFPFDEETLWTEDMVWTVNPDAIQTAAPEQVTFRALPQSVGAGAVVQAETHYVQYLLRYFRIRIYRNFGLNIYSDSGQTLDDFTARCVEMLAEPFRIELDNLHEIFKRKLEQIKIKYIKLKEMGEFDIPHQTIQFKSLMHEVSERIAQKFVSTVLNLNTECPPPLRDDLSKTEELAERLDSLEVEAHHAIEQLLSIYREKVRNIDEYIVHPSLKDIHVVRTCILWMPAVERTI